VAQVAQMAQMAQVVQVKRWARAGWRALKARRPDAAVAAQDALVADGARP
jgi:hypothetical protein